jgi:hypothetical protein
MIHSHTLTPYPGQEWSLVFSRIFRKDKIFFLGSGAVQESWFGGDVDGDIDRELPNNYLHTVV